MPIRQAPVDHPLASVLDAVGVGVYVVDTKRRVTHFNPMASRITGVAAAQALGRHCWEVVHCSLCGDYCPLQKALRTGQDQAGLEAVLIRGEGRSVAPVELWAGCLAGPDGQPRGGVVTLRILSLEHLQGKPEPQALTWRDFIGESPQVQRLFETLRVVAPTDATVLIEGPTGTGKDLLARIIHAQSPRRDKPFVKVNCAALPETLLESEMMGHVKGAFTGADRNKPGRFKLADGGTIFLDEISEMELPLQAKLLRVLEDREYYALGASETTKVDVRVIAACNRPLEHQVTLKQFREDLLYRLKVISVDIPPLKERPQDIPLLIRKIIQTKNMEKGTFICRFDPEALDLLLNYSYPGNVREMQNILEHACLLCQGDVVQCSHLPHSLVRRLGQEQAPASLGRDDERQELARALHMHQGHRGRTAQYLGIDRTTLWRRMRRLGLDQTGSI